MDHIDDDDTNDDRRPSHEKDELYHSSLMGSGNEYDNTINTIQEEKPVSPFMDESRILKKRNNRKPLPNIKNSRDIMQREKKAI